jgi:hypothetical protein
MTHICSKNCPFRNDLDRAAAGLARASMLLSQSMAIDSDELIENCYAMVRAAKAKFEGARAVYLEHLQEVNCLMPVAHTLNMDEKVGIGSSGRA